MEFPAVRWRLPAHGAVKINVHDFFSDAVLPNGNRSGIGVVIRNHRGKLLRLYGGSLGIEERRTNELYTILQGLIRAYLDEHDVLELETDNVGAFWEWTDSMQNGVPQEHEFVVRQLNTRREDENQVLVSRPIDESANALARYIVIHGAYNYDRMVIFTNPFGSVREIWSHGMGLGPIGGQFVPVFEEELGPGKVNEVADEMVDDMDGDEE